MKKIWFEIVINILFWFFTAWLITAGFSVDSREIQNIDGIETVRIIRNSSIIEALLIYIGLSALLFYANLWNILQLTKQRKKSKVFINFLAQLLISICIVIIIKYFTNWATHPLPDGIIWGTILFYLAISTTYALTKVWIHSDRLHQQLAFDKKQAELNLLRNQLHPHFLFNALNNLLSMVDQKQSPLLADSLDKLSGLLRYVVYDTSSQKVTIEKEIEFMRNFASLQQLRFEQKEIVFTLDVQGSYNQQTIEPGLFIPFIENAFKYGVEAEQSSKISVVFNLTEPSVIKCVIKNHIYASLQRLEGNGTGISSSIERLKLVYPEKHKLSITQNDKFIIELTLQTE